MYGVGNACSARWKFCSVGFYPVTAASSYSLLPRDRAKYPAVSSAIGEKRRCSTSLSLFALSGYGKCLVFFKGGSTEVG